MGVLRIVSYFRSNPRKTHRRDRFSDHNNLKYTVKLIQYEWIDLLRKFQNDLWKYFLTEKHGQCFSVGNLKDVVLWAKEWVGFLLTNTGSVGWEFETCCTFTAVTARTVDAVCISLAEIITIAALINIWKNNNSMYNFHYCIRITWIESKIQRKKQ